MKHIAGKTLSKQIWDLSLSFLPLSWLNKLCIDNLQKPVVLQTFLPCFEALNVCSLWAFFVMILRKCIPFFGSIRRKRWRKPSIFNCIQKDSNPSLRKVTFWPKVPRSQTPSIQRALNSVHFVTLLRRSNGLVAYLCNIRPAFTLTVVKIAQAAGKIETH